MFQGSWSCGIDIHTLVVCYCHTVQDVPGWLVLWYRYPYTCSVIVILFWVFQGGWSCGIDIHTLVVCYCHTVKDVPGWLVLWYRYPYTCSVLLSYCSGCSRVVGPVV